MGLGWLHQYRRSTGAVALAGMAFYAVLLPWHTVSQATGPPLNLGKSFEPPCHQASAAGDKANPTASEAADTLSDLQWLCGLPLRRPTAGERPVGRAGGTCSYPPHGRRWPCRSHRAHASEPRPT